MESTSVSATNENGKSASVRPKQCNTFTCFPKLPAELRNMIWEHASNLPRNLDIWARRIRSLSYRWSVGDDPVKYQPFKFYTKQPVPSILQTNRESRAIGHLHYHLSFETWFQCDDGLAVTTPARVYSNFAMDQIFPMGKYKG
ncbi:hypothetical protein BKA65DRAFT_501028 [Rhexocercosporidium sp. MPI-PUGE-AT-0058]|nr:hypothetical protein BKA65DRAFT_501028 [Rhexocercosporidium sp. MPI-PUGE-AT-0058]